MKISIVNQPVDLTIVAGALRMCTGRDAEGDSVSPQKYGPRDEALVQRWAIDHDHSSTLEHINYTYLIDGLSRGALQELARHRHASMSVRSTRYTLKELTGKIDVDRMDLFNKFCVRAPQMEDRECVIIGHQLRELGMALDQGLSNDHAKYMLPECFKTRLLWTINVRSLRNFLKLRSAKDALWEMRLLAKLIYEKTPNQWMFKDIMYKEGKYDV